MSSIDLRIGEIIQGKFELVQINILLVCQVNCPGCFTHALLLASSLSDQYGKQGVPALGLSTVFEDFSLNTVANTRNLLNEGTWVGETDYSEISERSKFILTRIGDLNMEVALNDV